MHAGFPAIHNIGRHEFWQSLKPKTCRLRFAMAELLGLDYLIWLSDLAGYDADWIFERDPGNGRIHKRLHEIKRSLLPAISHLCRKVSRTRHRKVCAWWMGNH